MSNENKCNCKTDVKNCVKTTSKILGSVGTCISIYYLIMYIVNTSKFPTSQPMQNIETYTNSYTEPYSEIYSTEYSTHVNITKTKYLRRTTPATLTVNLPDNLNTTMETTMETLTTPLPDILTNNTENSPTMQTQIIQTPTITTLLMTTTFI